MSNLFNNKLVSNLNKLNITSIKSGVNEANEPETKTNLIADMALNRENYREYLDSRTKMHFSRPSSDPNLGEASLDSSLSKPSGHSTPNKGHSSAGSMPVVGVSTTSTSNGISNTMTGETTSMLSPGEIEGFNGTESMSYGGASIVHNRATPILSAGSSVSKDELNRRYYDPYRTTSDVGSYLDPSNQLFTMNSSPEVTRGDQGGCLGENIRTSSEPARFDYRSGLEKESSISSDYCLFSENYGKCNFSDFSKNNLVLLLSFINTITRETLPVKCILLTLKTLLKCVKCELIELCQIDDNDLIINYMFKEGMLHKKEVKYHKRGLYNLALSTGMMIKVDDVAADERYIKECDQHTELIPRNIVLIPLYNLQQSIWGVVSLTNYRGRTPSSVGGSGGYLVSPGGVIGSTGSSNGASRGANDGYGTGGIGTGPVGSESVPGFEVNRATSSDSNLEREDSLMEGVVSSNGNAMNGGGIATDVNLVVVANNRDMFGNSSTMSNKGKMDKSSGLNEGSEEEEGNMVVDQGVPGEKTNATNNSDSADVHTGNTGSSLMTSIGGAHTSGSSNAGKDTTDIPSANANTDVTTNTVTASSNHSPLDSRYTTINSINSNYGCRNDNVNGMMGIGKVGGIVYSQMDEEKLKFISYLCFMSGIIISNAMEKIELEINKLKSNSLITLMHSLFSDQLGIQSCVIALTTHAKKLIQAESCAVYLVDQSRNQLWSISSNTGEQSVYSLDNNNNILSICVNTSKIIIYDNDLVNDGNLFNKSNIMAISNGTSVLDANDMATAATTGVASSASSTSSRMSSSSFLIGQASHEGNGRASESASGVSETGVDKEVLEKLRMLRNGIWVPIKHDNRVLAVIEVVNKQAQELLHFTEDDLNLLELFAVIVGPQFERSEFASAGFAKKTTEAGLAFENVDKYLNNNVKNFIEQSIIEEEEAIME